MDFSHLPGNVAEICKEITDAFGSAADKLNPKALEAYAGQIAIIRDCQGRISKDGALVTTAKGDVIPHPAIEIERKAQQEIRAWGDTFKPPRRR